VQSGVCLFFRQALAKLGFIEIHTPKLVGAETEVGVSVFKIKYFEREAYLAQSPQLAKQMAIIGDMERVYEIGPAFRAEHGQTARHLTEFTGLDFEMHIYQHYHEILDVIELVFETIFEGLSTQYHHELTVSKSYKVDPDPNFKFFF
jgi:aspartyl-tRNA synthetase